MSLCVAYVGEVIIKPEFRKDFGHFFRREFIWVEHDPLKKFVRDMMPGSGFSQFFGMSEWKHYDLIKGWEGHFKTRFDKEFGIFTYGIGYYSGPREFFTGLLPEITESYFEKESVTYDKTDCFGRDYNHSHYTIRAEVGRVIIKPEYREDFDYFFHEEYTLLQTELFKTFVEKHFDLPYFDFSFWKHDNEIEEWRGKYETSYDEESGRFVYGLSRKQHYEYSEFFDMLEEITETVISEDYWDENMY